MATRESRSFPGDKVVFLCECGKVVTVSDMIRLSKPFGVLPVCPDCGQPIGRVISGCPRCGCKATSREYLGGMHTGDEVCNQCGYTGLPEDFARGKPEGPKSP